MCLTAMNVAWLRDPESTSSATEALALVVMSAAVGLYLSALFWVLFDPEVVRLDEG